MAKKALDLAKAREVDPETIIGIREVLDEVERELSTKHHGVVERLRKVTEDVLQVKPEVSLGFLRAVFSRLENREVDYSVVYYLFSRSAYKAAYVLFKKDGENWVRRK